MGTNVIVDVVVGLVVLYWLVATFSSFVVEAVNSVFNVRGEALLIFVREMLAGDTNPQLQEARRKLSWLKGLAAGTDRPNVGAAGGTASLADLDITAHPLIRRLYKPAGDINKGDTAPSYIPAEMFTKALLDRLSQLFAPLLVARDALLAAHDHLPETLRVALRPQIERGLAVVDAAQAAMDLAAQIGSPVSDADCADLKGAMENAISASAGPMRVALGVIAAQLATHEQWKMALSDPQRLRADIVTALKSQLGSRALTLDDMRHIVQTGKLPDSLAAALRPLIDAANHDMEAFRKGLDDWYSSVMDRASGWFKRRAQWMLFLVALVAAAAFNLDTLYIARKLSADSQLREAAVQLGGRIVADPQAATSYGQQFALRAAFADGRWAERLGGATAQQADPTALRVMALSLWHGSLLAPMLAQQAVALRTDASQWKTTQREAMLKMAGNLCRARIAGAPGRQRDHDWASQQKDEVLAADARCKDERDLFDKALEDDPHSAFDRLWGSQMISWNPDLAQSAWRVHRLAVTAPAAAGDDESKATVKALADSIRSALASVDSKLGDLDSILSRLPDVGSTNKAFKAWLGSGYTGFCRAVGHAGLAAYRLHGLARRPAVVRSAEPADKPAHFWTEARALACRALKRHACSRPPAVGARHCNGVPSSAVDGGGLAGRM